MKKAAQSMTDVTIPAESRHRSFPVFLFQNDPDIVHLPDQLVAHRGSADGAGVIVFITFRKNDQEPFAHRHGTPAAGAEEFGGVEITVLFFLSSLILFRNSFRIFQPDRRDAVARRAVVAARGEGSP